MFRRAVSTLPQRQSLTRLSTFESSQILPAPAARLQVLPTRLLARAAHRFPTAVFALDVISSQYP